MREAGLSGRTVTIKVRLYDFTTLSRSSTLADPTDDVRVFVPAVRRLLAEVDTSAGVRLLGVGVSGLADWVQDDLFVESEQKDTDGGAADSADDLGATGSPTGVPPLGTDLPITGPPDRTFADRFPGRRNPGWQPGQDVWHADRGPGWVWGSGSVA